MRRLQPSAVLIVLSLDFCCFWVDEQSWNPRCRARHAPSGPRQPQPSVQPLSVLSSHPGRRDGGTGSEGGSLTYYGHLCDEDPPNGIGHPTGGKAGSVRGREDTAPGSGARGPGRPPLPSPPYARSVFSIMNLTFSSVSSVIRTVGWLAYGITTGCQSPAPAPQRACATTSLSAGHPGASG